MTPLIIDGELVTLEEIIEVARSGRSVQLGDLATEAIQTSRALIDDIVESGDVVYGVNTGFGKLADHRVPVEDLGRLQRNLVMSHAVGVGPPLEPAEARAMLVLRIIALARGYSGIRLDTVQRLIDLLNSGVVPFIPSKGSVGASGDLAPLAHLALLLIGQGRAWHNGDLLDGVDALAAAGLEPVTLGAKEGLALINGTQLMSALGVLLIWDAANVLDVADIAGALTLEAVRGSDSPFSALIQAVRPHPGQVAVAAHLRRLTQGSEIMADHHEDMHHKVQDPYSLRCMPQVHGAARDTVAHARRVFEIEINSATDNPLVFPHEREVISGGNFHGEPLAMALDFSAIALTEISGISERRTEVMMDPNFSELPPFLTLHGGVDSGYMVAQYTAAALVAENKVLAHPASVDSIPTSANQEDHVSMGVTAGLKARQVQVSTEAVLAIELLVAAEGLDFRRPLRSSAPLEAVHRLIRSEVPRLDTDRPLYPAIEVVTRMVRDGRVARAAESVID
ncbi:MAG: histidine ammonia-lyase [Chloroflexota bacterium]